MTRLSTLLGGAILVAAIWFTSTQQAPAAAPGRCIGCDFEHADLHGADLRGVRYTGSNLAHANLHATNFGDAMVLGGNFSNADASNAVFTNARLLGANFNDTNLTSADLQHANLMGAVFRNATLTNAQFQNAVVCVHSSRPDDNPQTSCIDLSGATVAGANFRGAQMCENDAHRHTVCSTVDAATLRTYSHSSLAGAILPR